MNVVAEFAENSVSCPASLTPNSRFWTLRFVNSTTDNPSYAETATIGILANTATPLLQRWG